MLVEKTLGPEKQHRFDGLVERAAPGTHEAIANYVVALGTSLTAGFCDIAAGNGALISRMRGKGFKNFVAVEWNVKDFRLADLTPVSVDLNLPFANKTKTRPTIRCRYRYRDHRALRKP
jgi:hypothetical protein